MSNRNLDGEERHLIRVFRDRAFKDQDGLCYWCDQPMVEGPEDPKKYNPRLCTADHIVPRGKGGGTSGQNIVASCKECNNKRSLA